MDQFITIYEISSEGYGQSINFSLTILSCILLVISILFFLYSIYIKYQKKTVLKYIFISLLSCVCSFIIFVTSMFGSGAKFDQIREDYSKGNYDVIEGIVRLSNDQSLKGHTTRDIIQIDGNNFEINYFENANGYKNTVDYRSLLNGGVKARLYASGSHVLRIDIEKQKVESIHNDRQRFVNCIRITWVDSLWFVGIIIVNILYMIRKYILFINGYGFSIADLGFDGRRLREIISKESSSRLQSFYQAINILIPVVFFISILIMISCRFI